MRQEVIAELKAEEEKLRIREEQLLNEYEEVKRKRRAVLSILKEYGEIAAVRVRNRPPPYDLDRVVRKFEDIVGTAGKALDPALQAAAQLLFEASSPVRTADILHALEGFGIALEGKNPQNTLSARLSNSPLFRSHGRRGWTLEHPDSETADEDQSPAVSDGEGSAKPLNSNAN